MPVGFIQLPADSTGKKLRSFDRGTDGHDQYVVPVDPRVITYQGRASTYRTPGRAGTIGQKIAFFANGAASTVIVSLNRINIDLYQTVVKAVTVAPPIIRIHRTTSVSGGTAITKVAMDTALTSSADVTPGQDAQADGTSSATAMTSSLTTNIMAEEFAPRLITAAGYEVADRMAFFEGKSDVILRAAQVVVVELAYTAITQNPITDMWIVQFDWTEFTE